jgi:hypothetical protein
MSLENATNPENGSQVYGFLCQKTNVFYAFESYENYQQFLQWLATQEESSDAAAVRTSERCELPMIDEAEQLADFEAATNEIMGVFNDPRFGAMDSEVELCEIDF